jgi:integrase
VPLADELLAEVRQHVGGPVPSARVSPGLFARTLRWLVGTGRFRVHQMRRLLACQWLVQGGSLSALQQVLGHASIKTMHRHACMSDEIVIREAERSAGVSGVEAQG